MFSYLVSQGRAVKAYGLEVSAPTGQTSMMFPDSSDMNIFSTYVPIWRSFPLPVVPRSSTPATSLAKLQQHTGRCSRHLLVEGDFYRSTNQIEAFKNYRTQRVHWIQRVMMVLMRGPMFLSSTALFPSVKRLRSEPNCMDWSWNMESSFLFGNLTN